MKFFHPLNFSAILPFIFMCFLASTSSSSFVSDESDDMDNEVDVFEPQLPEMILTYWNWTVLPNTTDTGPIVLHKRNEFVDFRIIIACKAPYPVKLVYEVNEKFERWEPMDYAFRNKVFYTDFYDHSTYLFYTRMNFRFVYVTKNTNFSCRSIANPCLAQQADFTFSDDANHMNITLRNKTSAGCPRSLTPSTTPSPLSSSPSTELSKQVDREGEMGTDELECDARFSYQMTTVDHAPYYAFRCVFADGSPGTIKTFDCTQKQKCEAILTKRGGILKRKKCWSRYTNMEPGNFGDCQPEVDTRFNSFVAICSKGLENWINYNETVIGSLAFYGVPKAPYFRPAIYFSEEDVDLNEMIYLEEFEESQKLGEELKAVCRLSAYYSSASFQFALEIDGENELQLLEVPPENHTGYDSGHYWKHVIWIKLDDPRIKNVYCFGAIQDSYDWLNASRPINFKQDDPNRRSNSNVVLIISIVVSSTIVIIIIVSALYLRWRRLAGPMRNLTEQEIETFLKGTSDPRCLNDYGDQTPIYRLPYNKDFETPRTSIIPDQSTILGMGEFGVVMKGIVLINGTRQVAAIKTTKLTVDVEVFLAFLSEIKIQSHVGHHPNIVSLVAACTTSIKRREALAALDYCALGDLKSFLRKYRNAFRNLYEPTPEQTAAMTYVNLTISTLDLLKFASGIANGMHYLSVEKMVIHGDLAARNVFLTDRMEVKVGDFGLSALLQSSNYIKKQGSKIPWKWYPIEALQDGKFSTKADVWSYAILLYEIFSLGQNPYPGEQYSQDFLKKLETGYRMRIPDFSNNQIYELMKECWSAEDWKRPPFLEIYRRLLRSVADLDEDNDYLMI